MEWQAFESAMKAQTTLLGRIDVLHQFRKYVRIGDSLVILYRHFRMVETRTNALIVAKAFKEIYGSMGICRELTIIRMTPNTILDEMNDYTSAWLNPVIHHAFIEVGFRKSGACTDAELLHEFCLDEDYLDQRGEVIGWIYDYAKLAKKNEMLKEELIMYLHHPNRMEKWIINNPERDYIDYLM